MMDKIVCPFSFFFAFPIFCFPVEEPSVFVRQLGREDFQDLCISHARSPWSPLQQYSSTLSQRILRSSHVKETTWKQRNEKLEKLIRYCSWKFGYSKDPKLFSSWT